MKVKIIAYSVTILVVIWLLIEVMSIESWSATTTLGHRIGIIEYRDTWGEFNRVTMSINEGILWVFGYQFNGPNVYGTFGKWMHTYTKDVSQ
jgi:hypothetical protein